MTRDKVRAGKRARRRGADGENEVRDLIRQAGFTTAHRQFQSGGQGGGDLADAIPDTHLEIKYVERLDLPGAWRQAIASARPTDLPVIVSRCNFQPWIASLRLLDLFDLPDGIDYAPLVIGPRAGLRGEFMGMFRTNQHPLIAHQMGAEAMATVLFSDCLRQLAWQHLVLQQEPEVA